MARNYEKLSAAIIGKMGGEDNITVVSHCYTRLRVSVRDTTRVDEAGLKALPGVMGLVKRPTEYQVVIGTDVQSLYNVMVRDGNFRDAGTVDENPDNVPVEKKKSGGGNPFQWILDFISGTFSPCIPVLIAGGLTGAVLTVLTSFFGVSTESGTYVIFEAIQKTAFYFLPVFVGFAAAKKLNINAWLGAMLGAVLLYSTIDNAEGLNFIGIPVAQVTYNTTVFPILLGVLFMSLVYRGFDKLLPKEIKVIFLPVLTMIITVPVTLVVLGPIGGIIGGWLSAALSWLYSFAGPVAVMIMGAATPFLVFFGMNNALYPLLFALFADLGFDPLICSGMLAANVAVGGACLGYAIRARSSADRGVAVSAGITGLLGITEPAVYGTLFPKKRPLIAAVIGGAVGGLIAGILGVAAYTIASPSFASIVMFTPNDGSSMNNLYFAIIVAVISTVAAFAAALLFGDNSPVNDAPLSETQEEA